MVPCVCVCVCVRVHECAPPSLPAECSSSQDLFTLLLPLVFLSFQPPSTIIIIIIFFFSDMHLNPQLETFEAPPVPQYMFNSLI